MQDLKVSIYKYHEVVKLVFIPLGFSYKVLKIRYPSCRQTLPAIKQLSLSDNWLSGRWSSEG